MPMMSNLPPILPAGTQVVTRIPLGPGAHSPLPRPAGAVAVIVKAPADAAHTYRVRFPDGVEANLQRDELAVLKEFNDPAQQAAPHPMDEHDLRRQVIYRCIIGSQAYGLENESSDTDRRGIFLPPADLHWSLYGVPEQLEDHATQECYWELQKFLTLALKANPNVLEVLNSPLVELATPLAQELLAMRSCFLSKLVYQTYNGYVLSQFKKMEQDLRNHQEIKPKHAMHLIRLLISGITALKEGFVPMHVGGHRDKLLAIRQGTMPWPEVEAWRLELHRQFDAAFITTRLPDRPDYEAANAFLLKARKSMVT